MSGASVAVPGSAPGSTWLFGRGTDLAVFAGSALLSVAVVAAAPWLGLDGEVPTWAWAVLVLGVDVTHVWGTVFRVYLDREELERRAALYLGSPVLLYAAGVAAYSFSALTFWRVLAYVALLHFVRQQVGFVVLYGRRERVSTADRRLDVGAVYAATVGPAVWWHAHLPRPFWWFVEGDFVPGLAAGVGNDALALALAVLAIWALRQLQRWARGDAPSAGKVLLVLATSVTWFGGIVLARSDLAFTVMNVVLHGVPYLALTGRYAKARAEDGGYGALRQLLRAGLPAVIGIAALLAFGEEWLWDRLVWHEHASLFGATPWELGGGLLTLVVPLLALPQATHYLLDAFIWRPSQDPELRRRLGWSGGPPAGEGPSASR